MTNEEKLRAFAQDVFFSWPEGTEDLDGAELQELGVKHGLLIPMEMTGSCTEDPSFCSCATLGNFPQVCFRKTPLLTGAA